MKNYDKTFKERALELYNETKSYAVVTEAFKISKGTLHKWIREGAHPHGNIGNKHAQKLDEVAFCEYVDKNPNTTQQELSDKFGISRSAIGEALKRLGYTYKKNKYLQRSQQS